MSLPLLDRCELVTYTGEPGTCHWCGSALPSRRKRWCSDGCSAAYGVNHWWTSARLAAIARDNYSCIRCDHLGWADVPWNVLPIEAYDRDLDPPAPNWSDWAIALGLLPAYYWQGPWKSGDADREARARGEIPASIHDLTRRETEKGSSRHRTRRPRWGASHELEVDHIRPLRGSVRHDTCENHQDNLRTLCRPCHSQVTRLQIVSARGDRPGQRGGTRTIACWEALHDECWSNDHPTVGCGCFCHHGGPPDQLIPQVLQGSLL